MPTYLAPGVYVEEKSSGIKPIEGVSTSVAAFIGVTEKGPVGKATLITNFSEFVKIFGGPIKIIPGVQEHYLYYAVRQFFTEVGTKCFVIRVVHYGDINDELTITAQRAYLDFDGTTVNGALRVSAINEGKWGEALKVQVENSSKFSLLLAEDIIGDTVKEISLVENSDVQIGSLLWIIEEVTGIVKSVDANKEITFKYGLTTGIDDYSGQITNGMKAITPDFKLITTTDLTAPVTVTAGTAPTGIKLTAVQNVDSATLESGSIVNFVLKEALVIVNKISTKVLPNGGKAMVVEFDPAQDFSTNSFDMNHSRVYARDFTIMVKEGDSIIETHENVSLVDTNLADHVSERLSPDSGNSFYIIADDQTPNDYVLMNNTIFASISNGDDGLAGITAADYIGSELLQTGLHALDPVKDASILVIPNATGSITSNAIGYCDNRKDMFYIIDHPSDTKDSIVGYRDKLSSQYAALYYPWIKITDPFTGQPVSVPPSGAIAGTYASTDVKRGVHKAPAGVDDGYLNSATGVEKIVTKGENDIVYQKEVNVIRKFPEGILVWGAKTISSDPEWKYINVRRMFIFLEQSIERGTQWVVFEPNDPTLWKSIKRNISAFLRIQWLEGKLVGATEEQAFFVKCDESTNPPEVVDAGQVITEIGVAPSKPAEFVVFRIKQFAGRPS